ncbi:hypothetical protein CBS101457_000101 [Exobasidium rhododendri]|nr:hypothetical protein CBS101457_000101 [Exobasidium rhododendri]
MFNRALDSHQAQSSHDLAPLPDTLQLYHAPSMSYHDYSRGTALHGHLLPSHEDSSPVGSSLASTSTNFPQVLPTLQLYPTDIQPDNNYNQDTPRYGNQYQHHNPRMHHNGQDDQYARSHMPQASHDQRGYRREHFSHGANFDNLQRFNHRYQGGEAIHSAHHNHFDPLVLPTLMVEGPGVVYDRAASVSTYVPPWEYTLPISTDLDFTVSDVDEKVYKLLTEDQRLLIVDRVHQIRPYYSETIRKRIQSVMNAALARDLLSRNVATVEAAVEVVFPIDDPKKVSWMTGLSNAQRRLVILKLADETIQRADKLRDVFLARDVTPQEALFLLLRANKEQCVSFAQSHELIVMENNNAAPWQRGITTLQRRAVLHRLEFVGRKKKRPDRYYLLQKRFIPLAFGKKILRASEAEFWMLMRYMEGKTATLPPNLL